MSDLGTLGLGNVTAVSGTAVVGTNPVLEVIASAADASYVHDNTNSTHAGTADAPLGDTPADFGTMDTLSIRARYLQSGLSNNVWNSLQARVFESDGSTALTNVATIASNISTTTAVNSNAIAFTGVNTTANKATWDAAIVRFTWNVTRNKGGDSHSLRVTAAEVTGTYTEGAAEVTGTGALASQSSTGGGDGVSSSTGTGALGAQASVADGAGTSSSTGTGAIESGASALSGAGLSESTGTGTLTSGASSVSGEDSNEATGTGALSAGSVTLEGSGISSSVGSGSLVITQVVISGEGAVSGDSDGGEFMEHGWAPAVLQPGMKVRIVTAGCDKHRAKEVQEGDGDPWRCIELDNVSDKYAPQVQIMSGGDKSRVPIVKFKNPK